MKKLKNTTQNILHTKQTIHKTKKQYTKLKNTTSIQNKYRNKKCLA